MSDKNDMASRTSKAAGAWRKTLCHVLADCVDDRPPLVPVLARAVLAGDDGRVMSMGDALADEVALEVVVLLLDHLLSLMRRVDAHFSEVRRLADGAALETSAEGVRGTLLRERVLLLPAVEVAEVLAELIDGRDNYDLRGLRAYGASERCPDGEGATNAVYHVVDVATRVERRIAEACPGRGLPIGRRWLGQGCDTAYGPYLHVTEEEAEGLIRVHRLRYLRRREAGLMVRALVGSLNACLDDARRLPEYDAATMGDWQFLGKRFVDKLVSEGVWAELPWFRLSEGRSDYERAVAMLRRVVHAGEPHELMTGKCLTPVCKHDGLLAELRVDVSMFLPEGTKAFVMGPCELYEAVSVWPMESIGGEAAELIGTLRGVTDLDEISWRTEQWRWLRSFSSARLVEGGVAPLASDAVGTLGAEEGDELLVVGCGNHIEIWNPVQWEEAERRFEEELTELMGEFCGDGDGQEHC